MSDLESRVTALEQRLAAALHRESQILTLIGKIVDRLDAIKEMPLQLAEIEAEYGIAADELAQKISDLDFEKFNHTFSVAADLYRLKLHLDKKGLFNLAADLRRQREQGTQAYLPLNVVISKTVPKSPKGGR
jgi:hypothetical protein